MLYEVITVHQIKTPVSVISMLTQMNEGNEDFTKIQASVNKINYNLSHVITSYSIHYTKLYEEIRDRNMGEARKTQGSLQIPF